MNVFHRQLRTIILGAAISSMTAPYVQAQPEEILKARSADEEIVFGKIVRVHDHRLDITDGKTARSVLLMPETVVEIDGRPVKLADIPAETRIRVILDPARPNVATKIVTVAPDELVQPVVIAPGVPVPPPVLTERMTVTPALPNAVETISERTANELESKMTPVVISDPVPEPPIGGTLETTPEGIRVVTVAENGPLAHAGLQVNDYIKQLGGENISTPHSFYRVLDKGPAGVKFPLEFVRGDQRMQATFQLPATYQPRRIADLQSPASSEKPTSDHDSLKTIRSEALGWVLTMPGSTVKIDSVSDQGPAAESGLKGGDQLVSVNDRRATSPALVMDTIQYQQTSSAVDLTIRRNGEVLHRSLTLPPSVVSARKIPAEDANLQGHSQNSSTNVQQLQQMQQQQAQQIADLQRRLNQLQSQVNALQSERGTALPAPTSGGEASSSGEARNGQKPIPAVPPAPAAPDQVQKNEPVNGQ